MVSSAQGLLCWKHEAGESPRGVHPGQAPEGESDR